MLYTNSFHRSDDEAGGWITLCEYDGVESSIAQLRADTVELVNTVHPTDWPLPSERAHQDALWFCAGGDQLL